MSKEKKLRETDSILIDSVSTSLSHKDENVKIVFKTANDSLMFLLKKIDDSNFRELSSINGKDLTTYVAKKILDIAKSNEIYLESEDGRMYVYNNAYWQMVESELLKYFLKESACRLGINELTASSFHFVEKLYQQLILEGFNPMRKNKYETKAVTLNCMNGTYVIEGETRGLKKFTPNDFLKYQLPFNYDSEAKCPMFDKYLDESVPDKESQNLLAEAVSHSFTKINTQKFVILYGKGSNGKSVFADIIGALLGKENVSNYPLSDLTSPTSRSLFHLSENLLNFISEIDDITDYSIFHKLVCKETVPVRRLYQDSWQMHEYASIMGNCNTLPRLRKPELSVAFYRRLSVIEFPKKIVNIDTELANKIIKNELAGVFNWVLKGLDRLLKQKNFSPCKRSDEILREHRKESDNVALFIEEMNYKKGSNPILLKNVFESYKQFCEDFGYKPCNNSNLRKRFENLGFFTKRINEGTVILMK